MSSLVMERRARAVMMKRTRPNTKRSTVSQSRDYPAFTLDLSKFDVVAPKKTADGLNVWPREFVDD